MVGPRTRRKTGRQRWIRPADHRPASDPPSLEFSVRFLLRLVAFSAGGPSFAHVVRVVMTPSTITHRSSKHCRTGPDQAAHARA